VNNLNFHIAYLLTRHECVIIPDFGAFIVSENKGNKIDSRNVLTPPSRFLSFNSEITHNDGLFANSIAREKNCGFKEAMTYVQAYSDDLRERLANRERIQLPWVGRLSLSGNGKILFTPAPNQSCNADFYGFTSVRLPKLMELKNQPNVSSKRKKSADIIWIPISRKIALYAASIAAAVGAMILLPSPLNDYPLEIQPKTASFWSFGAKEDVREVEEAKEIWKVKEIQDEKAEVQDEKEVEESHLTDKYFIVIASLRSREIAEAELPRIIAKGFDKAMVLSSQDKHRIVAASFSDRQEAVNYLRQLRKNNPKYEKAWLFY
jgi:nucleoid DNA-binding protein